MSHHAAPNGSFSPRRRESSSFDNCRVDDRSRTGTSRTGTSRTGTGELSSRAGASEAIASEKGPIRVMIVDSSMVLRPVLASTIGSEMDMQVSGQAATAEEAFEVLAETDPHVAIVDISLEDAHGLDLVQNIQAQYPQVQVMVFSMYDERVYAERAVRAGAAGYLMKSEPAERLIEAIRTVARQNMYLSRSASLRMLNQLARSWQEEKAEQERAGRKEARQEESGSARCLRFALDTLTSREMEVFRLVGDGKTTADVAAGLALTRRMVNVHQRRMRNKLGLSTPSELRLFAAQWVLASRHIEE